MAGVGHRLDKEGAPRETHRATKDDLRDPLAVLEEQLIAALRLSPAALFEVRRVPCRYCWGEGHSYQWKTQREYRAALEQAIHEGLPRPDADGGYGYRQDGAPNPDCPECCGEGEDLARLRDLGTLPPEAHQLIAGLKQGPRGPELLLRSSRALLQALAAVQSARQAEAGQAGGGVAAPVAVIPRTELVEVEEEPLEKDEDREDWPDA